MTKEKNCEKKSKEEKYLEMVKKEEAIIMTQVFSTLDEIKNLCHCHELQNPDVVEEETEIRTKIFSLLDETNNLCRDWQKLNNPEEEEENKMTEEKDCEKNQLIGGEKEPGGITKVAWLSATYPENAQPGESKGDFEDSS